MAEDGILAMETSTSFLTPARSKALSKVLLNVAQLMVVGMFLSERFSQLALVWRVVAMGVVAGSLVGGLWFAAEISEEN